MERIRNLTDKTNLLSHLLTFVRWMAFNSTGNYLFYYTIQEKFFWRAQRIKFTLWTLWFVIFFHIIFHIIFVYTLYKIEQSVIASPYGRGNPILFLLLLFFLPQPSLFLNSMLGFLLYLFLPFIFIFTWHKFTPLLKEHFAFLKLSNLLRFLLSRLVCLR